MEIDFTSVVDRVTSFDSKTLEPDLDKFISKLGLGIAIADKFAKNNSFKTSINNDKTESDTNKNIMNTNKNTPNVPSCNL